MATRCTVCLSEHRDLVESAVWAGASYREMAKRTHLGRAAIGTHMQVHAGDPPERPRDSPVRLTGTGIDALIEMLEAEVTRASGRARLEASRELRMALAERAKSGILRPSTDVRDTPGWEILRGILLEALAGEPGAKRKVADAIREFEAMER